MPDISISSITSTSDMFEEISSTSATPSAPEKIVSTLEEPNRSSEECIISQEEATLHILPDEAPELQIQTQNSSKDAVNPVNKNNLKQTGKKRKSNPRPDVFEWSSDGPVIPNFEFSQNVGLNIDIPEDADSIC